MTQADRVLSTPPTNAPIPQSRRGFLGRAVTVLAAGTGLNATAIISKPTPTGVAVPIATAEHDPAFVRIAEKLAADAAHCKAIDEQDEADVEHGFDSQAAWDANERCEAACHAVNKADWLLATTRPTTLAGVAAVLRFANAIEDGGMEWPGTDTIGSDGWHYQLRATMAAAIEALITDARA